MCRLTQAGQDYELRANKQVEIRPKKVQSEHGKPKTPKHKKSINTVQERTEHSIKLNISTLIQNHDNNNQNGLKWIFT